MLFLASLSVSTSTLSPIACQPRNKGAPGEIRQTQETVLSLVDYEIIATYTAQLPVPTLAVSPIGGQPRNNFAISRSDRTKYRKHF